ncbi:GIY-YIG nuclease family protein [Aeromicrobium wangtongii]|uniref:GIY-YIG nuclease family protein n=1 Tax=Aeromicrobium wangtongii TaxID=2969247 RepID=A0ABY5M4V0_9ACTN|nr:GIY-YIG nuclease family protein [Aeromicrobium wangtongii]MCD9198039.1 GIY-YIG nuclease family protein [Aeromicrobium wangtongii]UUP12081.1 GIY-YIG nuclease family protein [Aeromicrobium wangtongii]
MAWVYILECSDGSYYVGSTRNMESRLWQHQEGRGGAYTSQRLPVRLVYACEFARVADAWGVERKLHGWSRAKREALIRGDFAALPNLSRNREARGPREQDE